MPRKNSPQEAIVLKSDWLHQQSSGLPVPSELMNLLHSEFFTNYQLFTEQVFAIADNTTLTWNYVSENIHGIMGFTLDEVFKEGLSFLSTRLHPDDIAAFNSISQTILETTSLVPSKELCDCRFSFDYRLLFGDKKYHRVLQHNIPLATEQHQIKQSLIIITDITPFKSDNYCGYQAVNYSNEKRKVIIEGTIGNVTPVAGITTREKQMIELTAQGLTEKRIAESMGIGIQTVKTYRKNLFRKTGCKNAVELVRYGVSHLLI